MLQSDRKLLLVSVFTAVCGVVLIAVPVQLEVDDLSLAVPVVVYGAGLTTFGLMMAVADPRTGTVDTRLLMYRTAFYSVSVLPLSAAIAMAASRPVFSVVGLAPLCMLYVVYQIDWDEAEDWLRTVRDTDSEEEMPIIPPESHQFVIQMMYGTIVAHVAMVLLLGPFPVQLFGVSLLPASVGLMGASPHRGSVRRTIRALQTTILAPGVGLLLAGVVSLSGTDTVNLVTVGSLAAIILGAVIIYYGLVRISWGTLMEAVEELRRDEVVTWGRADEAIERVTQKNQG